jgi:hypothetical protein
VDNRVEITGIFLLGTGLQKACRASARVDIVMKSEMELVKQQQRDDSMDKKRAKCEHRSSKCRVINSK